MSKPDVFVPHAALSALIASVFQSKGMSAADAATVAGVLVWADLRGVGSHGASRVQMYLDLVERGEMVTDARPAVKVNLPAAVIVDGHRAAGPVAMSFALDHAMAAARRTGTCYAVASDTTHTGAIGYYAERAANQGFAAIVTSSGPPNMAYYGARSPSASTSPLAIAVPGPDGPMLLDMATAIIGMGRLAQARERGEAIPEGSALDASGEPTVDPATAAIPLSLGGPKGAGMSLMFECLSSIAAGVPVISSALAPGARRRHIHNGMIILVDVAQLCDIAVYRAEIGQLSAALKRQPSRDGVSEILMPGERGGRAFSKSMANGVAITAGTWAKLAKIAGNAGLALPSVQ